MSNKVVNAALTAILAVGITGAGIAAVSDPSNSKSSGTPKMAKGLEKCYGVAKAGLNDCAYAGKGCAGSAKMDGEKEAWITVPKGTCSKIVGGNTQPPKTT